jgi:hypothetical protein
MQYIQVYCKQKSNPNKAYCREVKQQRLTLQARWVETRDEEQAVSVETQGPEKLKV